MMAIALIVVAALCGTTALALTAVCIIYRCRRKVDYNSPQYQLLQLKRKTRDFGVAYQELKFAHLLGKGSQGEVYQATWRGLIVAVKKIDTHKVPQDTIEEFCQEAEIMHRLRHPCLTLFMGVCLEHPHLCIVTEFVQRGSLFDLLHDENAGLTWKRALSIAVDVAQGLSYLHGHKPAILHRDLKSLNILISESWRAKVADFGMTRFHEDGTMTQCGSPLWMAPEMIKNEPYDEKSDVYSFGIVLWELYTKKIPYRKLNLNPSHLVVKVVKEGLRPVIPSSCPKAYARLMEKCWHHIPDKRPTFSQILKVLDSFQNDPMIRNHKPGTSSNREAKDDEKDLDEKYEMDKERAALHEPIRLDLIREHTWHIKDMTEVQLRERIVSKHPLNNETRVAKPEVWRAIYRGKDVVAVLFTLSKDAIGASTQDLCEDKRVQSVMKELANTRDSNVMLFVGAFGQKDRVGVLMEHAKQGSLYSMIANPDVTIDWDLMMQLFAEIAAGFNYLTLHKSPFVHPDVSSKQILIDQDWSSKITGYSFVSLDDKLLKRPARPTAWTAPEVLADPTKLSAAANVFSFAMVMWEVVCRKRPHNLAPVEGALSKKIIEGYRPDIPSSTAPRLAALIKSCWAKDPAARPTFEQIVTELRKIKTEGPPKITLELGKNAFKYRKAKTVFAYRTKDPVTILKDWGKDVGKAGSYLIVSGEGEDDVYTCDEDVFRATYEAVDEKSEERMHEYRKHGFVIARCMEEPFALKVGEQIEQGNSGDYLVQNEKGDQWVIEGKTFNKLYERDKYA